MSTSLALNDGAAAPAGAEQPEKKTKTKKKAKQPKLTKAEKQAAKAEKNAEKAEAKAYHCAGFALLPLPGYSEGVSQQTLLNPRR